MRISLFLVLSFLMCFFGWTQLLMNFEHFSRLIATDWVATSLLAFLGGATTFFYELRKLENEELRVKVRRYRDKLKAWSILYKIPLTPLDLEGFLTERELAAIWDEIQGD